MMFQPPPNASANDIWIGGLILASLVWIETMVIVWLVIALRSRASLVVNKGAYNTPKKKSVSANLPQE